MGYIGEITRQGNVPETEPMSWPEQESIEKEEKVTAPEKEEVGV